MKTKLLTVLSASLLAICLPSFADDNVTYKSAMFDFSGQQLVAALGEDLMLNDGSVVLYCQSEIDQNGSAQRSYCYQKGDNHDILELAEKAISGLPFAPAQVDGEEVPVRMSYRVGINKISDGFQAVLIPNLGSMQDRYGRDYIAPQERLDISDWYDRYNQNSWVNGELFLGGGDLSRVAATVNENGKTEVVRALDTKRAYKRDAGIVKSVLKKSRFIPGFVDGEPVPMAYLAVVNYGDSSEGVVSKRYLILSLAADARLARTYL